MASRRSSRRARRAIAEASADQPQPNDNAPPQQPGYPQPPVPPQQGQPPAGYPQQPMPPQPTQPPAGYPQQPMPPQQGYPAPAYPPPAGYPQQPVPPQQGYPQPAYPPPAGYPQQPVPPQQGYPQPGYPQQAYAPPPMPPEQGQPQPAPAPQPAAPTASAEPTEGAAPTKKTSTARRRAAAQKEEESPSRRSGRRRSSRAGDSESAGRKPAIGRDGKANIACPNCAFRYKIAEEHLESKVTCTQCHRAFYPLAAAKSRRAAPDHSKPIIIGAVAVVFLIVVGVIISNSSGPASTNTNPVAETPKIDTENNPIVDGVMAWARSVGEKDVFNALMYTDVDAVQKKLGIEPKNLYSRTFGDDKKRLEKLIFDALFTADETLVFRAYRPTGARVREPEMVTAKAGTVKLNLYPRDSTVTKDSAEVEVTFAWDTAKDSLIIRNWAVLSMARVDLLLEAIDKKNPAKKHVPHQLILKAQEREVSFGGKKTTIMEAELVPLPHLETTPEADRKQIDILVEQIADVNAGGMIFNRACNALEPFGKAAVPRVLNKMYEIKMKSQDDVLAVSRLCRFMRQLTGERFGFNPAVNTLGDADVGASEKERISALKQWYAWWARYHDRDNWRNIDSDEEIELTTEQIEAKRKADAEKARQEREERRKRARGR